MYEMSKKNSYVLTVSKLGDGAGNWYSSSAEYATYTFTELRKTNESCWVV